MPRDFSEQDWKVFRRLHQTALERFCQRIVEETAQTCTDAQRSHHERYLAVYELIQKRDREVAAAFNDMRRSAALQQLLLMCRHQLLTKAELAEFSPTVQEYVQERV